jgi:hypothetical protein
MGAGGEGAGVCLTVELLVCVRGIAVVCVRGVICMLVFAKNMSYMLESVRGMVCMSVNVRHKYWCVSGGCYASGICQEDGLYAVCG